MVEQGSGGYRIMTEIFQWENMFPIFVILFIVAIILDNLVVDGGWMKEEDNEPL